MKEQDFDELRTFSIVELKDQSTRTLARDYIYVTMLSKQIL